MVLKAQPGAGGWGVPDFLDFVTVVEITTHIIKCIILMGPSTIVNLYLVCSIRNRNIFGSVELILHLKRSTKPTKPLDWTLD